MADRYSINQALFGYSDGHRLLASSLKLPTRDLYLLAAASDLASGVRLRATESYLSGLMLPDAEMYCLIRTWPAPEMPRPGCVWSHVLFLDNTLLSTWRDLGPLRDAFVSVNEAPKRFYSKPLEYPIHHRSSADYSTPASLIEELLTDYYDGSNTTLSGGYEADELEAAVLAVWSQQWPKLRRGFSFRLARGAERRSSSTILYDVWVGRDDARAPIRDQASWVRRAASDARRVGGEELREFLWRYGQDVSTGRATLPMLVRLFETVQSQGQTFSSLEVASSVLRAFPGHDNAKTLKRDMLGIGDRRGPETVSAVSVATAFFLAATFSEDMELSATEAADLLRHASASDISTLARNYAELVVALPPLSPVVADAIAQRADEALLRGDMPEGLRTAVLSSRPDLISAVTIGRLTGGAVVKIAAAARGGARDKVAEAIVGLDYRDDANEIALLLGTDFLRAAINAYAIGGLHPTWHSVVSTRLSAALDTSSLRWIERTSELAAVGELLGYPSPDDVIFEQWSSLYLGIIDDVEGTRRTELQAFLFCAAVAEPTQKSWPVVLSAFPQLRIIVLEGSLSPAAYRLLDRNLPSIGYDSWDLGRRLLAALAQLWRTIPDQSALAALPIDEQERSAVASDSIGRDSQSWSW